MLPTSTRFVVSVHMLAFIAGRDGAAVRSEEIATDVGTNPAVIRALLSRLSAADLTTSQRGKGGGALLARPANEIRLLDVYLAVEDREIFACHDMGRDGGHSVGGYVSIGLALPLRRARDAMERELASATVQDIVDEVSRQTMRASDAGEGG